MAVAWTRVGPTGAGHGTTVSGPGGQGRTGTWTRRIQWIRWTYWTGHTRTNEKSSFVLRFSGISILTL